MEVIDDSNSRPMRSATPAQQKTALVQVNQRGPEFRFSVAA